MSSFSPTYFSYNYDNQFACSKYLSLISEIKPAWSLLSPEWRKLNLEDKLAEFIGAASVPVSVTAQICSSVHRFNRGA